jgi:uncharacterized NAD(P)/FAD-binding protein YdhS
MARGNGVRTDATLHKDVISRRLGDRAVVVNLRSNRIYELNASAARLWELLEAGCEQDELERALLEEYDVHEERMRQEVAATLASLSKEGLINADVD